MAGVWYVVWMCAVPVSWLYRGGWRQRFADRAYASAWLWCERRAGRA